MIHISDVLGAQVYFNVMSLEMKISANKSLIKKYSGTPGRCGSLNI